MLPETQQQSNSTNVDVQTQTLISENLSLRSKISNLVTEIDIQIAQADIGSPVTIHNILDDLPIEQQISLYQDSISQLKNKLQKINHSHFERIENEIKGKTQILYSIRNFRQSLLKVENNHNRAFISLDKASLQTNIDQLIDALKNKKKVLKQLRMVFNVDLDTIKEQNNAIYTLEDNCRFIKENIQYKKNFEEKQKEKSDIMDLQRNVTQIEELLKAQEDNYNMQIRQQKEIIVVLSDEIGKIKEDLVMYLRKERIEEIKSKQTKRKLAQKKREEEIKKEELNKSEQESNKDDTLPMMQINSSKYNKDGSVKWNIDKEPVNLLDEIE